MTERQGFGLLYNIPHFAESFITHCLFYRFTHRAPRTLPNHCKTVNIFNSFGLPACPLLTSCFFYYLSINSQLSPLDSDNARQDSLRFDAVNNIRETDFLVTRLRAENKPS